LLGEVLDFDDLLHLPSADYSNPLFGVLSPYLESAVPVSNWHARVSTAENGSISCEDWISAGRELQAAEFLRRARRMRSVLDPQISKLSDQRHLDEATVALLKRFDAHQHSFLRQELHQIISVDSHFLTDRMLNLFAPEHVASESNVAFDGGHLPGNRFRDADARHKHTQGGDAHHQSHPSAYHQSSQFYDLNMLSHDVVVPHGIRLLQRELIEGPVRVGAKQVKLTDRVQEPTLTRQGENKHIHDRHRRQRHHLSAEAKEDADRDELPKLNDRLYGHLPFVGQRVSKNRLHLHTEMSAFHIEWTERKVLHQNMIQQDEQVWTKVRTHSFCCDIFSQPGF
jgi:hypothetical protein